MTAAVNMCPVINPLPDITGYDIPQRSQFGDDFAWWHSENDLVFGVVFRVPLDQIEYRGAALGVYFGSVVLSPKPEDEVVDVDTDDMLIAAAKDFPAGAYRVVEADDRWFDTAAEATAELHAAMLERHEMELRGAIWRARVERVGFVERRFGDQPEPDDLDVQTAMRCLAERVATGKADAPRRPEGRTERLNPLK